MHWKMKLPRPKSLGGSRRINQGKEELCHSDCGQRAYELWISFLAKMSCQHGSLYVTYISGFCVAMIVPI